MSPLFHGFGEHERSQSSLLYFPEGETEAQGREESCTETKKLRDREAHGCAQSHRLGGEPQTSGAPVTFLLRIPHGSLGHRPEG